MSIVYINTYMHQSALTYMQSSLYYSDREKKLCLGRAIIDKNDTMYIK